MLRNGMVIYAENQNSTELGNTDAQMAVFRTLLARHGVKKAEVICLVYCPIPNSQNSLPMRLIFLTNEKILISYVLFAPRYSPTYTHRCSSINCG